MARLRARLGLGCCAGRVLGATADGKPRNHMPWEEIFDAVNSAAALDSAFAVMLSGARLQSTSSQLAGTVSVTTPPSKSSAPRLCAVSVVCTVPSSVEAARFPMMPTACVAW